MATNDPIADLLTRIRNAQRIKHSTVRITFSKMAERFLIVMQKEGFIESFEVRKDRKEKFDEFEVTLKYDKNGDPVIMEARRMSKPGLRRYESVNNLPTVHCGLGIAILSTSQGVMSDREARKQKIGGEVLAYIS